MLSATKVLRGRTLGARPRLKLKRTFCTSSSSDSNHKAPEGLTAKSTAASLLEKTQQWASKVGIGGSLPPRAAPPRATPSVEKSPRDERQEGSQKDQEVKLEQKIATDPTMETKREETKFEEQFNRKPHAAANHRRKEPSQRLLSTSHMEGVVQRIAYHLMFRPVSGKTTGKLPIQVATLAPSHAFNAISAVVQATLESHRSSRDNRSGSERPSGETAHSPSLPSTSTQAIHDSDSPPRTTLIIVPSESYKFQAMEAVTEYAQLPISHHWTILTEDEFWSSLFPGYSNDMTPYIDSLGCVVVSRESAAEKFASTTSLASPAPHAVRTWASALQQNTEAHHVKSELQKYCVYSTRELLWSILKPQTSLDHSHRIPRLQHAIQALKSSHLTDIMPFNTSIETLGMLASLHGLSAQWKIDPTIPNFLSSYHNNIPAIDLSRKAISQANWLPNTSMALNFLEYSNRSVFYISLANNDITNPDWVEKSLEFIDTPAAKREKCASYDFWEGAKANPLMISKTVQTDPFPLLNAASKNQFQKLINKSATKEPIDQIISPRTHLEMSKESIGEVVPILLSAASRASSARDTPMVPLRILSDNNVELIALQNMLEMQGIPTLSQNLFATPAAHIITDLFTILIELSKQGVLDRAKELEEEAKTAINEQKKAQDADGPKPAESAEQISKPAKKSTGKADADLKKGMLLQFGGGDDVNLAAAFHTLLQGAYGFDTRNARHAESRLMYQHLKFKDPMLSLLLGVATNAKYLRLRPNQVRRHAVRTASTDMVGEERQSMMSRELESSVELATEDAEMMIGLLNSDVVSFRTKALASEIVRVQQNLSLEHIPAKVMESSTASSLPTTVESLSSDAASSSSSSLGSSSSAPESLANSDPVTLASDLKTTHHKGRGGKSHGKSHSSTSASKHRTTSTESPEKDLAVQTDDVKDALYSGSLDPRAVAGAKQLYQDMAYLIGAIRAMPLSPSEIVDLFIARHIYRGEIESQRREDAKRAWLAGAALSTRGSPSSSLPANLATPTAQFSEETIVLMRAFADSLKGIRPRKESAPHLKSTDKGDALTGHYISNAQYLQKALTFAKNAYVEVPAEAYQLATSRARAITPAPFRPPYTHPVILGLDHYAADSGDFAITLRVYNDGQHVSSQPHLLPPPAEFFSQISLYGSGVPLNPSRDHGSSDEQTLKVEFEAQNARLLFSSSLLYSLSISKFSAPPFESYVFPSKESLTLKALLQRMQPEIPKLDVPSLAFESHAINNPNEESLNAVLASMTQSTASTPNSGSHVSPEEVKAAFDRTIRGGGQDPTATHPALDFQRKDALPPIHLAGPSFMCMTPFRPRSIGATALRTFRDCQVQFALRYVWSVEPGNPGSLLAATGVALHEAASKVHAHIQQKLAEALTRLATPPTPEPDSINSNLELDAMDGGNEAGPIVEVTLEDSQLVHDAMVEDAFKKGIMEQGMTEEEAETMMADPTYRKQMQKAKTTLKNLWELEKEKQTTIGKKHKEKKEKEILAKKKEREEKTKATKAAETASAKILAGKSETPTTLDGAVTPSAAPATADASTSVLTSAVNVDGKSELADSTLAALGLGDLGLSVPATAAEKQQEAVAAVPTEGSILGDLEAEEIDEDLGKGVQDYSFTEQGFSWLLPTGQLWQGAWDRVDIDPETGEVEITEYKTNLRKRREAGMLQLQTYALAYYKIHGVIPSKLVLASLSDTTTDVYRPTKLDLIRTENLIVYTAQRMTEGLFTPTYRPLTCRSCPYTHQCPGSLTAHPLFQGNSKQAERDADFSSSEVLGSSPEEKDIKRTESPYRSEKSDKNPDKDRHHDHKRNRSSSKKRHSTAPQRSSFHLHKPVNK